MKKIFYITSIGIFSILSSCSSVVGVGESKIGKQQPSLSNTRWEVIGNLKTNARPYISFDPETGMNGNGGCNRIFSQNVIIKSQHGDFSIKNIGITRMACPSMDMNVETNFVKMLESANKYVVDKNTLELYKGNMLLIKLHKN
ncbi:META domain-containing protein [Elizabethkingia argentiflava]|uniref:META domain-containing protein n=1 Tax=Elizabethkingia argenteiflava TaxID=2681556 RepID=A0A845PTC3_9FLAO|nr:META domain-containing protein [Elizabethkingia argenteiflava]NAW50885.1 META domain-containing protein [Elizabethkingia argenteiflava]